jgi:CRP/FNR family transcriptional regulator
MMWAVADIPNKYYFDTLTEAKLWRAPRDKVLEFIKGDQEVLYDLVIRLFAGMAGTLERLEHLTLTDARKKVIHSLIICTHRFGQPSSDGTIINLPLKQDTLASIAGTTKETLNREISKLKKAGILDYQGNLLLIRNPEELEDLLSR